MELKHGIRALLMAVPLLVGSGGVLAQAPESRVHAVTADDPAAHRACRGGQSIKVAVTGASGLAGSARVPFQTTGGHEVVRLVPRAPRGKDEISWDPEARLEASGDRFRFPDLAGALQHLLGRTA